MKQFNSMLKIHVMMAVRELSPNGYGMSIRAKIKERVDVEWPVGSIYHALEWLKLQGLIESRKTDSAPHKGGRRKTCFIMTPKGRTTLNETLVQLAIIPKVLQ